MNNVNILGTLTRDIELRYLPSGSAVANFSIAVNQDYKKDGETIKKTSFFNCVSFGKQAEILNQYFHKGSRILINGELNQETYEKDGQNREKITIRINSFDFIDKKDNNSNTQPKQEEYKPQTNIPEIDIDEESIPF